jgi:uncharacterized Zn-finger protein
VLPDTRDVLVSASLMIVTSGGVVDAGVDDEDAAEEEDSAVVEACQQPKPQYIHICIYLSIDHKNGETTCP